MKLDEAIIFDDSRMITESMITEGFIDNTLKPMMSAVFGKRVDKQTKYRQQYEAAMAGYVRELTGMGVDGSMVRDIARRKARHLSPETINKGAVKTQISEMIEEIKDKGFRSLTVPIISVAVAVFINTMMMMLFVSMAGPVVGMMMTAVLIGPVTEEIGRFINVRRRDGGRFNIIFNITEYFMYVFQAATLGIPIAAMAVLRILPVIMHTLWTVITRKNAQADANVPPMKSLAAHALFNAMPLIGSITTVVMARSDNPEARAGASTRMVVFGIDENTNKAAFRNEIIARNPDLVLVQAGIDTSGIVMSSVIDGPIVSFTDFSQVREAYTEDYQKIVVIMDNSILNYSTKEGKWLMNKLNIEIFREREDV